jgi:hypothetical protein
MSALGISSSSLFDSNAQSMPSRTRQSRPDGQRLGQDLQSGNPSAAQADLATLPRSRPQSNAISSPQNNHPSAQQSGNLAAAQRAYSTLQQDFQRSTQSSGLRKQASPQSSTRSISVKA